MVCLQQLGHLNTLPHPPLQWAVSLALEINSYARTPFVAEHYPQGESVFDVSEIQCPSLQLGPRNQKLPRSQMRSA